MRHKDNSTMDSMEQSIAQYRESMRLVRDGLERISGEIGLLRGETIPKELLDRRYLLYTELGELQYALGSMEEYCRRVRARSAAEQII